MNFAVGHYLIACLEKPFPGYGRKKMLRMEDLQLCGKTCESALYAKSSLPAEVHLEEIIWVVDLEQPFAIVFVIVFV